LKLSIKISNLKKNLLFLFPALLLLVSLYFTTDLMLPDHSFYYSKMQHMDYIGEAKAPFTSSYAPYCWRIFIPLVVHVLPLPHQYSFFIITVFSLLFTGLFVFIILKHYDLNDEYSFYGVILYYGMVWAVRFNLIEFWYPDALLYLLIAIAVYAALKRMKFLFLVVLLLGVTIRKQCLRQFRCGIQLTI